MPTTSIRSPKLDELPAITDLAWRCYDHIKDEILDDRAVFADKIRDGLVHSRIAIEENSGTIVGHACLKRFSPDDNVAELGVAFVDPAWQGHGIAKRLSQDLYALAQNQGADGVFDCSVTTHPYTQKTLQACPSVKPCSIMFKIAARGLHAKGLELSPQDKGSVVNHYNAFTRTAATVYCPPQHADMVREIYGWHGLPRTFAEPATDTATGPSQVFAVPLPEELDASFIITQQVGATTADDLEKAITAAKAKHMGAVFAFLPLSDPHTPALVKRIETLGFSFAGIMPHIHDGGDRLILQWIASSVEFDSLQIHGEHGQRLFDYVKNELIKTL